MTDYDSFAGSSFRFPLSAFNYLSGESVYTSRILLGIDPLIHGLQYRLKPNDSIASNNWVDFYPNPATNLITFEFEKSTTDNTFVEIRDLTGKLIYSEKITSNKKSFTMNVDFIKSGIYLVKVKIDNEMKVGKLIKQ